MKRGITGFVAIAALVLGAGISPGNVDAAPSPRIKVSQGKDSSLPGVSVVKVSGSGFEPSASYNVAYFRCTSSSDPGTCENIQNSGGLVPRNGRVTESSIVDCGYPGLKVVVTDGFHDPVDSGVIPARC